MNTIERDEETYCRGSGDSQRSKFPKAFVLRLPINIRSDFLRKFIVLEDVTHEDFEWNDFYHHAIVSCKFHRVLNSSTFYQMSPLVKHKMVESGLVPKTILFALSSVNRESADLFRSQPFIL